MARKKKNNTGVKKFFFTTRLGFYSLVIIAAALVIGGLNLHGYSNFESDVLGEKSQAKGNTDTRKSEEIALRSEQNRQEIKNEFRVQPEEVKVRFERKAENIERKVTKENEESLDIDEESKEELGNKIEEEFELENDIEIASSGGDVTIKKDKVKARTGFPLSLDLATNQLIITRPDGTTKAVAVLPDKAVENFMRHKKINLLNFEEPGNGSGSAEPGDNTGTESAENTEDETQISLIEKDDELVYKIQGKKKLKLLGLFPVTTPTTGYVSAETGEVVDQEEPLITTILDFLSP
jgi:hypothetical protein